MRSGCASRQLRSIALAWSEQEITRCTSMMSSKDKYAQAAAGYPIMACCFLIVAAPSGSV
eukprot:1493719-Prorocentrum_lima.AAC.1